MNRQKTENKSTFYFAKEEGISAYWRRNHSTVPAIELTQLLVSLRKLTGFLGMNVGQIIWDGMKLPDEDISTIILDPSVIRGKYPVPAIKTDYLVGITVREACSNIEWSEKAAKLAWDKTYMDEGTRHKFKLFLSIIEKIYLDLKVNNTVLNLYTEVARKNEFNQAKREFIPSPSLEEFMYYCWMLADKSCRMREVFLMNHDEEKLPEIEALYREPLFIVLNSMEAILESFKKNSVLERCNFRSNVYVEIWNSLLKYITMWPADRQTALMLTGGEGASVQNKQKISAGTLKAIENAINDFYDFSSDLVKIADRSETLVTTRTNNLTIPMEEKMDKQMYLHIKAALRTKSKNNKKISRGLQSGKIDPRRIYRAPVTGNIFMYNKAVYELNNDVVLLIDASSSMVGPKWKTTQRIFSSIYEALKDFNKDTRVFAYYEAENICMLSELVQKRKLYTVVPRGKTASGEAIIATALMLLKKKRMKRPLIVHITDGASNWGCGVESAIEFCKEKNIGLITLGIGTNPSTRALLEDEYGKQVRFIDNINTLPKHFSELVNIIA